jgi:hypothetical protein
LALVPKPETTAPVAVLISAMFVAEVPCTEVKLPPM